MEQPKPDPNTFYRWYTDERTGKLWPIFGVLMNILRFVRRRPRYPPEFDCVRSTSRGRKFRDKPARPFSEP
jgi:hypothetical protein